MATIDKILKLMKVKNINAAKLSKEIGISSGLITQWKQGLQHPSQNNLKKIAEYFNVSTDYLLGITDNPALNKTETTEEEKIAAKIFTLTADQRRNVEKYIDFIQTQ